jgi:hypothetical protein
MHVAPACAGFGDFASFVRSLSLHFCKRLFPSLTIAVNYCVVIDQISI